MQYLKDFGLAALASFLATFGGCLSTGCATKVTSLGAVSSEPVLKLDLPGMALEIRSLEMTFEHGDEEETTTP